MTIYIDLVIFINFMFDFNLLLALNILLKRRKKILRIFLGALFGSLSVVLLFFSLNSFILFILKVIISIFMILITFGKTDFPTFKDNLTYLYLLSIILGGTIYLISDQVGYKNSGLFFVSTDYSLNLFIILILTPILLILHIKILHKLKTNYSKYYQVDILLNGNTITLTAFLDTGNKLICPITKKPVILVEKNKIPKGNYSFLYVPYNSLNNHSVLKCLKPDYIIIEGRVIKNVLIGLSEQKFNIPGTNCILNERILL